jgi:NAD(P)-dependent dehydrogenase (short-subunit alcohol dehydrogenase family)
MAVQLKPLDQQVIVITGASSGIGLAAAKAALARGAKVVLAARSVDTLDDVVHDLNARGGSAGGEAIYVPCDVGRREEVERVADEAIKRFGRIDTWVNNAGVSIYGKLEEVGEEDFRKLFDTNFWGVVHGSLIALKHLRAVGGALINLGSEVSESVVPLQGMYSASKHAVKGFTDALRVEVEEVDKLPISITLIQPTATDTPFPQNARNYMDKEPKLPDPQDKPEDVAEAILDAAVTPTRSKKVGALSKVNTFVAKVAPGLGDKIAAKQVDRQQYDERPRDPDGSLYKPSETGGQVHGSGGVQPK